MVSLHTVYFSGGLTSSSPSRRRERRTNQIRIGRFVPGQVYQASITPDFSIMIARLCIRTTRKSLGIGTEVFCCWPSSPVRSLDLQRDLLLIIYAHYAGLIVVFKGQTTLPWWSYIVALLLGGREFQTYPSQSSQTFLPQLSLHRSLPSFTLAWVTASQQISS